MVKFEVSGTVEAGTWRTWEVLSDVERWPEWTASMQSVKRLDGGPLGVGSRVRIQQPRMMPGVWMVTAWNPGEGFVWESNFWGAHAVAEHWIKRSSAGSEVVLRVTLNGLLASLLRPMIEPMSIRYMQMEMAGLKKSVESSDLNSRRVSAG